MQANQECSSSKNSYPFPSMLPNTVESTCYCDTVDKFGGELL